MTDESDRDLIMELSITQLIPTKSGPNGILPVCSPIDSVYLGLMPGPASGYPANQSTTSPLGIR